MRLQRRVEIDADRDAIWKRVSDPASYPDFMANLERWDEVTEGPARVGSRFTGHWKIGSVPVGGVIEVVEFDEARDLAWIGITGVTQRGRFRLRDCANGRTQVSFRMAYEAPGGLLGLVADWVSARQVDRTMAETLENLRRLVEEA
jgi:uncharacterized membrane protein